MDRRFACEDRFRFRDESPCAFRLLVAVVFLEDAIDDIGSVGRRPVYKIIPDLPEHVLRNRRHPVYFSSVYRHHFEETFVRRGLEGRLAVDAVRLRGRVQRARAQVCEGPDAPDRGRRVQYLWRDRRFENQRDDDGGL